MVWVGFDDNRELNLEGAKSALPIWADFMKQAAKFRRYQDVRNFQPPPGSCRRRFAPIPVNWPANSARMCASDVFIDGTQPAIECQVHSLTPTQFADRA